jgi:hypothetical protein
MQPSRSPHRPPPSRASSWPTSRRRARERERPGCRPVFQNIGAHSADQESPAHSVSGCWTDSKPGSSVCVLARCMSAIASVPVPGAGDGLQPPQTSHSSRRPLACVSFRVGPGHVALAGVVPRVVPPGVRVSYRTIAAALALEDVSIGERPVAFSLASYADAEHQTFVGNPAAAARAGLSRSRCLAAPEQLEARELISVAAEGGGRGRSSTLTLGFAKRGPWREERTNPPLFQTAWSYTRSQGPARVLLATLAALADDEREVVGLTTEEIRNAAGLSDRTYRRARASLLASGELVAESCVGGRGNTNRWRLADTRSLGTPLPGRRVAPLGMLARSWRRRPLRCRTPRTPVRIGRFLPKPRQKGRRKPRRLTRARGGNQKNNYPPTPLTGGAGPSRSRSSRTSSPTAAANDSAPSLSRSTRSACSFEHPATPISLIGSGSAAN